MPTDAGNTKKREKAPGGAHQKGISCTRAENKKLDVADDLQVHPSGKEGYVWHWYIYHNYTIPIYIIRPWQPGRQRKSQNTTERI